MAGMGTPMRLEAFIQEHSADLINTDFGSWLLRADFVEKLFNSKIALKFQNIILAEGVFTNSVYKGATSQNRVLPTWAWALKYRVFQQNRREAGIRCDLNECRQSRKVLLIHLGQSSVAYFAIWVDGFFVGDALVAIDTGAPLLAGFLHLFPRPLTLMLKIHRIVRMTVAAFATVGFLHRGPNTIGHIPTVFFKFLWSIDLAGHRPPYLTSGLNFADDFWSPCVRDMAIRTYGPNP